MDEADLDRLVRALHPLDAPPDTACWNAADLDGLIDPGVLQAAAVLVGLVPRDEGWHVLLTRRNDALRQHAGQVSFPGGRIDPGDLDAVDAALRETQEEIGVSRAQIRPVGFLDALATVTGFRVVPVVAIVDPAYVADPDPAEVAEVFEVPLGYLMAADNRAERRFMHEGRTRSVWEYRHPSQRIWGVTASILINLQRRLEGAS